jgi:hypothetical protein
MLHIVQVVNGEGVPSKTLLAVSRDTAECGVAEVALLIVSRYISIFRIVSHIGNTLPGVGTLAHKAFDVA